MSNEAVSGFDGMAAVSRVPHPAVFWPGGSFRYANEFPFADYFSFPFREFLVTKVFPRFRFFLNPDSISYIPETSSAKGGACRRPATSNWPGRTPLCSLKTADPNSFVSAILPVSTCVCPNLHKVVR